FFSNQSTCTDDVADLLVQSRDQLLFAFCLIARSRREEGGQPIQCLPLPLGNLRWMHSIFGGDLIGRFLCFDRFQGDLGLQVCAVSLALTHPCVLLICYYFSRPLEPRVSREHPCSIHPAGERLRSPHGATDKKRSCFPWQLSWANRRLEGRCGLPPGI